MIDQSNKKKRSKGKSNQSNVKNEMSPSSVLKFFLIFRNIYKILSIPKIGLTSIECDDFVTRNKLIISQILLNVIRKNIIFI